MELIGKGESMNAKVNSEKYIVLFSDCIMVNDFLYLFSQNYNAFYSYDFVNERCTLVGRIPNEDFVGKNLVCSIHYYCERIYFIPKKMVANRVWIFDLNTHEWDFIDIKIEGVERGQEKIAYSTIHKDKLIMIGCFFKGIIQLDLKSEEVKYYNVLDTDGDVYSLYSCLIEGDNMLIPSPNSNSLFKLNLETLRCEKTIIGEDNFKYVGIEKKDGYYWMAPRGKLPYLVRFNGQEDVTIFNLPSELNENGDYFFYRMNLVGEKIILSGENNKKSLVINNDDFDKFEIVEKSFVMMKNLGNQCFIAQDYSGTINLICKNKKMSFEITQTAEELSHKTICLDKTNEIYSEKKDFDLKFFLHVMGKYEQ